jgi:hypothetical protein
MVSMAHTKYCACFREFARMPIESLESSVCFFCDCQQRIFGRICHTLEQISPGYCKHFQHSQTEERLQRRCKEVHVSAALCDMVSFYRKLEVQTI